MVGWVQWWERWLLQGVKDPCGRWLVFFFQAEDGIRDGHVTGVQTCALPICGRGSARLVDEPLGAFRIRTVRQHGDVEPAVEGVELLVPLDAGEEGERGRRRMREIGRASCRERWRAGGGAECE